MHSGAPAKPISLLMDMCNLHRLTNVGDKLMSWLRTLREHHTTLCKMVAAPVPFPRERLLTTANDNDLFAIECDAYRASGKR